MAVENQRGAGHGGIFPVLAVILCFVTVISFFGAQDPQRELRQAWENTAEEFSEDEKTLIFLKDSLLQGSVDVSSEQESFSYTARLPEEARLSFGGENYNASLTSKGEKLALLSAELLDAVRVGERGGAVQDFFESAYLESNVLSEEVKWILGMYLSLGDPDLLALEDRIGTVAEALWGIAEPSCKRESAKITVSEKEIKVKNIIYTLDSEDLKKMWTLFSAEAKKEDLQNSVVALYRAIFAVEEKGLSAAKEEAIRAFLRGEGEMHQRFNEVFLSPQSQAKFIFSVYKNRVIQMNASLKSGDVTVAGDVFFGEKGSEAEERRAEFSVLNGETALFSAKLSAHITENSAHAFVREWNWNIADEKNVLLEGKNETAGKIRYSWGKSKKDLGLRVVLDEREVTFGGTLSEYKFGKRCKFDLIRMELDRKDLLGGKRYAVSLVPTADGIVLPEGAAALFPQGEEKAALKESFGAKYHEVVK